MTTVALKLADQLQRTPPYVAHKTLINFVNGLSGGVPAQIDKSIMRSLSGATQSQLIAALRYLDLIESNGKPRDVLLKLIDAEGVERQKVFREVVTSSYAFVFSNSLDLERATKRQIEDLFAGQKLSGETRRKALGLFLALSLDAGLKVSPHLKVDRGKIGNGGRRQIAHELKNHQSRMNSLELLLAKLPNFDPDWSDEIKTRWFDSFDKLRPRNKP
jgi:hypothetical protein